MTRHRSLSRSPRKSSAQGPWPLERSPIVVDAQFSRRWPAFSVGLGTCVLIALGGGSDQYPLTRFAGEAIGIAILAALAVGAPPLRSWRLGLLDWLVVAAPLLVLLQLVPLPPHAASALPGREFVEAGDALALSHAAWRPVSLDPAETWRAFLMLLAPLAIYVAMRAGGTEWRRAVVAGALVAWLAAIVLTLFESLSPSATIARLYETLGDPTPTGYFVNRNHNAIFLVAGLPLVCLFLSPGELDAVRADPVAGAWPGRSKLVLALLTVATAMAVLATGSRAGLIGLVIGLILTGAVMSNVLMPTPIRGALKSRRWATILILLALIAGLIGFGDGRFAQGWQRLTDEYDNRFEYWPVTLDAVRALFPAGSGAGTFRRVFEMYERPSDIVPLWVNHAHSDWLEIALEAGVAGMALALTWVLVLGRMMYRPWCAVTQTWLCGIMLLLFALHSIVDYPLRTIACLAFGVISVALIANIREATPCGTSA